MKRRLLVAVPILCLVALLAWFLRPKHESLGSAYVSERSVTLWSGVAQVREQLGVLLYGDRVEVLARRNDNVKVRTAAGLTGWVDGRYLMEPELWQRSAKLLEQAKFLPVQARGRTKTTTNLRVAPGRTEPRLYQFGRGAELEILGRAVADWEQVSDEKDASGDAEETKQEDWFLVRGVATRPPGEGVVRNSAITTTTQPGDQTIPIAGWVIGRFVSLDVPDAVREGTNSANVRPWPGLNSIASLIPMAIIPNTWLPAPTARRDSPATSPRCAFSPGIPRNPAMKPLILKTVSAAPFPSRSAKAPRVSRNFVSTSWMAPRKSAPITSTKP